MEHTIRTVVGVGGIGRPSPRGFVLHPCQTPTHQFRRWLMFFHEDHRSLLLWGDVAAWTKSYFIAVGSVSEPGLHQSISWIPAGECGQFTSPQSVRTAGFVLPAIGLRSNKTVTWHPIPSAMPMMRPAINAIVEIMAWSLQEF